MSDIDSFLDGVAPAAQNESQIDSFLGPEKSSTARRVLGDGGVSVMKGLAAVPESLVGIADVAAGGRVGKAVEDAGIDFKGAQDYWGDMYSPEQKLANENVAAADGFVDKLGAIADNPSVIPHAVIESVPAMFAGGFIGKGVKALPVIGKGVSSLAAGAIGEGSIMAGGAAENMRQQTEDGLLNDQQQLAALGTGVVGAALGAGGAAVGKKLGLGDIDTAMVDGTLGTSARSMPARIAGGAAGEGLLEEMPQSGAETALENYGMDRPLDQGVGGAMAMGAVTGAAMGGAFGAMSGRGEQPAAEPVPEADPVAELAPAVDLVQPTPTPENPAPAPVPRPDPALGALSRAASLLPAAAPLPAAAVPLAEASPLLGEQVNPATGEIIQQPAPTAVLDAGQPVADQQAKSASLIERGRAAREQAAQEVPPEMLQDQLASLQGEPAVKESVPKKAAKKRALKKAAKAAETEEQLREQLAAIEKHARGNGGWNTNTSKVRAELRTKLDAFDSAKPVAATPPSADGYAVRTADRLKRIESAKTADEVEAIVADEHQDGERHMDGTGRVQQTAMAQKLGIEHKAREARNKQQYDSGEWAAVAGTSAGTQSAAQAKAEKMAKDDANSEYRAEGGANDVYYVERRKKPTPAADPIQGKDIDGDWASFSESSGTLNVPRAQMPQIKAEHRGAMVNFLNARGVTHEEQTVPATSLKPTQAEFSREKVAKAKGYDGGDRSILVSSDGHVLDGHHQWLAKREAGDDVKVIRLGAPISDLLGTVAEFPSATQAEGATPVPAESAAPDTAIAENTTAIAVDPVAEQPVADPVPAKKPAFISKAQADHLFGTDKKREAALERIASGKAWFLSESRAKAFVKENGLADTHAVMQDNKRFVIDVKPDPDGWQPVFGFGSKGRKEILQAVVDMRRENPAMDFRTVNDGDNLAIQSRKAPVAAEANDPVVSQKVTTEEKTEAEPKPEPAQKNAESQFAGNKVFTADAVAAARARMKSKLGQLNSGIDPELMMDGMTIAGAYIESGMRSFAQYAKAMVDDMGDGVKPYLLSFWEAARHFPGVDKEGMTSVEESARLHAELNKVLPVEEAAALGSEVKRPAVRTKKNGTKGDTTLTQDWGVDQVDGHSDDYERESGNSVKDQFIKDAAKYLGAVADTLRDAGYQGHPDKKGLPSKPVSKNEGGVAGSGDITLTMRHPSIGTNVYVHIGESALRGVVPMTPSGIAVMYRVSSIANDQFATKNSINRWSPVDLSAADLAAIIMQEAGGRVPQMARPAQEEKRNEQPANGDADQGRAQAVRAGGRDSQPAPAQADSGIVEAGQPADVRAPDQATDAGRPGLRQPAADVAADGAVPGGRDVASGRAPGSRAGAPDAGAGNTGAAAGDRPRIPAESQPLASPAGQSIQAGDFHIDNPLDVVGGTPVVRFNRNRAALELMQELQAEGRQATAAEQKVLAGYIGWGSFGQELFQGSWDRPMYRDEGVWKERGQWLRETLGESGWKSAQRSITNAHYTDPPTVMAMWDMVRRMGFDGGKVLEPSMGTGNFYSMMPADLKARSQLTGIELDEATGAIAKQLFPKSNVRVMGYQESKTPDNFYDLVIGNWPFENTPVADRRYNKLNPMLHDYFFLKAMDQVRPGGIVIGITSAGSMDKKSTLIRRELAKQGELVASVRLPSGAFQEYAGTKVVTDIVILRKRPQRLESVPSDATWVDVGDFKTPSGETISVNRYYLDNPQNVIGTLDFGRGTTTFQAGMIVHRPENMAERLKQAVSQAPENALLPRTTTDHITYYANAGGERHGALFVSGNDLMIAMGDQMVKASDVAKYEIKDAKKTAAREAELKALVDLGRKHLALVDAERADGDADAARKALNASYKAFVQEHGSLRGSFGLSYLSRINDPFHDPLAALESDDGKPAAVLTRNTTRGKRTLENPTVRDAYVLARNESVNPSLKRIAELSKKPEAEARAELLDIGAVFETPNGDVMPSDIYLSGNVREKLREAQAALDDGNKAMAANVAALQEVMPEDVLYFNIETKLGATWVPSDAYKGYIAHMLSRESVEGIDVSFQSGRWRVRLDSDLNRSAEASTNYGTGHVTFSRLAQAAMSNQTLRLTSRDSDGNDVYDPEKSEEANARISKMREDFGAWLWGDLERRQDLEREYNEARNAWATPKYDGSFMTFEGMALTLGRGEFNLRQHQVNAIWRAIVNRRSINAHEVGTGKTFTMGGIAIESRRYGIAKKPVILAHNANSASVAAEIRMMYPSARVLYIDNLDPKNRAVRLHQIANDDWDAIVLPHSLIDRLALREETLMEMAADDIAALEAEFYDAAAEDGVNVDKVDLDDDKSIALVRSVTAKELAKARKRIIETIKKQGQQASKEGAVAFEDLGIDMILVDEAHEFKKPPIVTRMQMKGLNTQVSDRSIALQFLTRYVRRENSGGNVHTFTGTPITNTITEIYHQMKYVMESEMDAAGVSDWDGWFGSFATEVQDVELTPAGDYEMVTRLAGFVNVPELRQMIGQYMDTVFADDMPEMQPRKINGKELTSADLTEKERAELINGRTEGAQDRPYKKVINESAEMTAEQQRVFRMLQGYAKDWRDAGKKQRKEWMADGDPRSPIVTEGIANKASFDARLLDDSLAGMEGNTQDEPDSKASRVVKNVIEIYNSHEKAGQVIFADMGMNKSVTRSRRVGDEKQRYTVRVLSTMNDIVERLVQGGIPREQIALVGASTNKEKRREIAEAMNTGAIRVVLGSTDTLGVGVNMQRNLRAMHHLDAPYMPGELEQRNGRGQRQGNQWNTVLEYRYMTDRLDGRRWQILAVKQRFITAFMKASGGTRTIEGEAAADEQSDILESFSEAAGDPRVLQRVKIQKKIDGFQRKERLYAQGIADMRRTERRATERAEQLASAIEREEKAGTQQKIAALLESQRENFRATIDGQEYDNRAEAVLALKEFADANVRQGEKPVTAGKYGDQELAMVMSIWSSEPSTIIKAHGQVFEGKGIIGAEARMRNFPKAVQEAIDERDTALSTAENMRKSMRQPFSQAADLERSQKQLDDLEKDLAVNPVPPPAWLRQGAPIDSEVFRKGRQFIVTGHRYGEDGWFVIAEDEKGSTLIPYLEATDSSGMRMYEEREFVAPEVMTKAGKDDLTDADKVPADSALTDVRFQRSAAVSGATRSTLGRGDVEQIAIRQVGKAAVAGRFVFSSWEELPQAIKDTAAAQGALPGEIKAVHWRGKTYLVDRRFTDARDVERAIFHEYYAHYGLRQKYGKDMGRHLLRLLGRLGGIPGVQKMAKEQGFNIDHYIDGAEKDQKLTESQRGVLVMDELMAHMAEATGSLKRLLQEWYGLARNWVRTNGWAELADLNAADLAHILREARLAAQKADGAAAGAPMFQRAKAAGQTATEAFKRWFGDSKVVDADGKPLILKHGTAEDFTVFDQGRAGRSTGHATAPLGIFMTADASSAKAYAVNASEGMPGLAKVLDLYASIRNPYEMTVAQSQSLDTVEKSRAFRADLERQGYDGIQLKGTPVWIAFSNTQMKSATDNNGEFDEFDPDIRFSRTAPDSGIVRRTPFNIDRKAIASKISGKLTDWKPAALGALPLQYLRDFAPKSMTALGQYIEEKRQMDADRNEMHTRYDAIAQRWLKLRWGNRKAEQALADLMHAATLAGIDPSKGWLDRYHPEQRAEYNRLAMQFKALPAEHQGMFRDARDAYKAQIKSMEDVIEENIRKSSDYAKMRARRDRDADIQQANDELTGEEREEAIEKAEKRYYGRVVSAEEGRSAKVLLMRKKFESMRVDEPYFPLKRFGEYFVALRDGKDLVSFSMFESAAEMNEAAEQMRKTYPGLDVKVGRQSAKQELEGAVDPAFVVDLQELVSRLPNSKEVSDQIYQMYLNTMPDFSMRKGFIHRKKTAGFNRDALRTFSSSMFHSSYQIARMKHSLEMNELVEQIEDQGRAAADPVDGMTIANEMRKRHEWVMNPKGGSIAQHVTSAAFVYQLGATPAAAFVNTTQTWMMGVPVLGTRFGSEAKALAALGKASKDFIQGRGHIEKKLAGSEAAAFAEFLRMGLIDKTQAHDLAGVGETGVEYNPVRHKVMGYISWMFHNAERYNREVTVMAGYRMGREAGLSHEAAIKEAAELTWTIHFDYSSGNRARYMQSDTAKILLVFRQHSVNMLSRLVIDIRQAMKGESKQVKAEAKRRLAGMFAMFAIFAGAMGVPGMQAILMLLNAMDDDDDPWTAEDKIKRAVTEAVGEDMAKVFFNGVPGAVTGVSLTDRIGMGSLWFWSPGRELEGQDAYYYWMEQVLGAAPAMVGNAFTGLKMVSEGNVYRGVETMMPKAIKDVMRSGRYADEGLQTMGGDTIIDELGAWEVVSQAMGFTPAHVAEQYDRNSALKNAEQHVMRERRSLMNGYAMATRQGDTEKLQEIRAQIADFNSRYSSWKITGRTLMQSNRSSLNSDRRTVDGIVLNKKLEYLRDEQ